MTQTINLKVYSQLVAEVTPKVIETEDEYEQFLAVAERLTFKQEQTPEESALYDLVTMLVETYEAQHYEIEKSSPAEVSDRSSYANVKAQLSRSIEHVAIGCSKIIKSARSID